MVEVMGNKLRPAGSSPSQLTVEEEPMFYLTSDEPRIFSISCNGFSYQLIRSFQILGFFLVYTFVDILLCTYTYSMCKNYISYTSRKGKISVQFGKEEVLYYTHPSAHGSMTRPHLIADITFRRYGAAVNAHHLDLHNCFVVRTCSTCTYYKIVFSSTLEKTPRYFVYTM